MLEKATIEHSVGEKFGPDQMEELAELRKRQVGGGTGPFDEGSRQRLLELAFLEEAARRGERPLSDMEKKEYLQLTREQIESKEWTAEKSQKLLEFRKRLGL